VKLGNPHGPKPFTAEARQQDVAAQRQQANARAEQLGEILSEPEFAGQSANAIAKALNDARIQTRLAGNTITDGPRGMDGEDYEYDQRRRSA
jgi:hypothetical protein